MVGPNSGRRRAARQTICIEAFPNSVWTTRAFVRVGQLAEDAKGDASYFYRAAVNFYPGAAEVAPAQFYIAWQAHDGKNLAESSRLLTEHLANYADRNTDFRGKAAYWAARDSERSGKLAEARAIYQGLQARYDANWYGYLAQQRLDTMNRNGNVPQKRFSRGFFGRTRRGKSANGGRRRRNCRTK